MFAAAIIVILTKLYAVAGLVFAVAFLSAGVSRIDPAASGAGLGFRLLILPGTAALWPLLLWKWVRA